MASKFDKGKRVKILATERTGELIEGPMFMGGATVIGGLGSLSSGVKGKNLWVVHMDDTDRNELLDEEELEPIEE